MLAARKEVLLASTSRSALDLRSKELGFYIEVLNNFVMQSSILVGFAYVALVELEITDDIQERLLQHGLVWVLGIYYLSACATMATAIYILAIASACILWAHQLALQGPTGSVERALAVVMKARRAIVAAYVTSMMSMVAAACTMAVIKIPQIEGSHVITGLCVAVFGAMGIAVGVHFHQLRREFRIDPQAKVSGGVVLREEASCTGSPRLSGVIDASRLFVGAPSAAAAAPSAAPRPGSRQEMRRSASATGALASLAQPLLASY
jgi:hypothetical protein